MSARLAALALLAVSAPLAAQLPSLPRSDAPPIQLRGELGSYGEMYRRRGAEGRRPGETGRLYMNGNALLFGSVNVGVNLLLSSEDGVTLGSGSDLPGRQSIGQLGLHPRWRWGSAHLGAFSDNYTPLTYSAVQLRGAAFDLQPGRIRFGAFAGRAASPVFSGAANGTFRRTVAGGRLGFGRQQPGIASRFIEVAFVRAWDDPNSLPAVDTALPPSAPLPAGSAPVNPYAVTPEENLVASVAGGLVFMGGRLAWRGELASAIHTRDVRAAELDSSVADMPGVLRGLIKPRVGTHADYAFSSNLQLSRVRLPGATSRSPRTLTASLGYRYVGPGYTSLGVASLANDVQAWDGRANIRFTRWSAQLQAGRQNDNLIGQKLGTTVRYRLGGSLSVRATRAWNVSFRGSLNTMGNGSLDSLNWMDYRAWSLGTSQLVSFGPARTFESISLDYQYQSAGDANPLRIAASFAAHSLNARLSIRASQTVQISPTLGLTRSQADTLEAATRLSYGVSAAMRSWGGRLTSTGSVGRSRYDNSRSWMVVLGSRLQVTPRDDLMVNLQHNRFADTALPERGFHEEILSIRWARRL